MTESDSKRQPPFHTLLLAGLARQIKAVEGESEYSDNPDHDFLITARYLASGHMPEAERADAISEIDRLAHILIAAGSGSFADIASIELELPHWLEAIRSGTALYLVLLQAVEDLITKLGQTLDEDTRADILVDMGVLLEAIPRVFVPEDQHDFVISELQRLQRETLMLTEALPADAPDERTTVQ